MDELEVVEGPGAAADGSPRGGRVVTRADRWLRLGSIAVAVVVAVAVVRHVVTNGGDPERLFDSYGYWALFLSVPLLALSSGWFLPTEFIAIAQGSVYGFWIGLAANWSGWMLTALLQYLLVRGATNVDTAKLISRLPRRLQQVPFSHPLVLIIGRQLPFGGTIVNTGAPVLGVPLWRHLWCSAIAIAPLAVICALVGSEVLG